MSTARPPRAPAPASAAASAADDECGGLVRALAAAPPRLLRALPPAAVPGPGALDALLLRGVALVAYAAGADVVIARGADLGVLRVLGGGGGGGGGAGEGGDGGGGGGCCRAVAWRGTDGALAAGFDNGAVVVWEGWSVGSELRGKVYDGRVVARGSLGSDSDGRTAGVCGLSWSKDGQRLAAVGERAVVWDVEDGGGGAGVAAGKAAEGGGGPGGGAHSASGRLNVVHEWPVPAGGGRLDIGVLSPDGRLLAGASMHARVGHVWQVDAAAHPPAELVFGWEGVATMQWKHRGGGGPALMSVDRDGSLRLWARVSLGDGIMHMEEVARSPHVEGTGRAGAAFVQWGGGGGVADDESDAAATAAAHPFIVGGAAPKPSRALHWVVRVSGGACRAWRVRGLDDRPRPEFARLEPGSGHAMVVGTEHRMYGEDDEDDDELEDDLDDGSGGSESTRCERRRRRRRRMQEQAGVSLDGADVVATRALAPVPLTTSSSRRIGLVKSYATSNGERRLRSAEPPGPPTIASVFLMLTQNGQAHVARYDMSPTSDAPAACRARVGAGHSSVVSSLSGVPMSFSAGAAAVAGSAALASGLATSWLLSHGTAGEAFIWRADPASPTSEPLVLTACLPGPHLAASFAPPGLLSPRRRERTDAVFAVDAVSGSLHLYRFADRSERSVASCSVQNVTTACRVTSCSSGNTTGGSISLLVPVPLVSRRGGSEACLLLGFSDNGRACCWRVARPHTHSLARFEPVVMRFDGRRFGTVTAADAAIEFGTSKRLLATGSSDGCVRLYEVVDNSSAEDLDGLLCDIDGYSKESVGSDDDDGEGDDGIARFEEVAFLGEKDGSEAPVTHVNIMAGGERVAVSRRDGSAAIWERTSAGDCVWQLTLSIPMLTSCEPASLHGDGGGEGSCEEEEEESVVCDVKRFGGISFGRDVAGQLVFYVSRVGLDVELYRKPHGTKWERSVVVPVEGKRSTPGPLLHIGQGILVVGDAHRMLAYDGSPPADAKSYGASNGAGYSPPRNILAHLMSGGLTWQTIAGLEELCAYVEKSSSRPLSSSSYAAGRGLAPPPPPLSVMISCSESPLHPPQNTVTDPGSASTEFGSSAAPVDLVFAPRAKRDLFAELMAKSEAKFAEDEPSNSGAAVSFDLGDDSAGVHKLVKLSKRLRVVTLAGLSRAEQNVLSSLALAGASVEGIITTLDSAGARFALIAATFLEASQTHVVPSAAVSAAVHSSASDALSQHFFYSRASQSALQSKQAMGNGRRSRTAASVSAPNDEATTSSMWTKAYRLGAGWWLSTVAGAKGLIEQIARTEYSKTRDANSAALWYIALGRIKPLAALYRAQQDLRMAAFLSRNFREDANKVAAGKNAYVLVSKHRHHLAVAFFILAGDYGGALSLVRSRLKDDQLALILARVLDNGLHVEPTLDAIVASAQVQADSHLHAIALWLRGHHIEALQVLNDSHAVSQSSAWQNQHGELERALGDSISPSALALGHLSALASRPPIRGTTGAIRALADWRERAMYSLTADGSPVSALRIGLSLLDGVGAAGSSVSLPATAPGNCAPAMLSKPQLIAVTTRVVSAAAVALKERVVATSRSVRSGVARVGLLAHTEADLRDLSMNSFGATKTVRAACSAAAELSRIDEIDSAIALSLAALRLAAALGENARSILELAERHVLYACYLACGRAVSRSLCALSPLHRPAATVSEIQELQRKMKAGIKMMVMMKSETSKPYFDHVVDAMKRATLVLRSSSAYLRGDWSDLLAMLRSCEEPPASLRVPRTAGEDGREDEDGEGDTLSRRSTSSSLAPESISLEGLRHMASNPAVLGLSPLIGHRRRRRRAPSLALADQDGASAAVMADERSSSHGPGAFPSNDPIEFIKAHPALNSALGSAAVSYLTSHQASRSASLLELFLKKRLDLDRVLGLRANLTRLQEVSESFEHVAADSIAGWTPLVQFGSASSELDRGKSTEEAAGAFIDLWCALGCLPEYAPTLSEAATVAAAEVASAAAQRAAVDEEAKSSRTRRRRKSRMVTSSSTGGFSGASKSTDIFDTTSADSLFGAFPVRFSAVAKGPWSGRGGHARLYSEENALFRTLCISSSDPPAVVVATPRGIQEVVPSSYTAMPSGFRSHYFAKRKRITDVSKSASKEPASPGDLGPIPIVDVEALDPDGVTDSDFMTAEDISHLDTAFGEGSYMALDMKGDGEGSNSSKRSSYASASIGKDALWRHQVQATALATHPLRRRFASGGDDGAVRLWDFGDPVSLGALRHRQFGRVSALKFSAYGNALVSVHVSGHVAVWQDPEACIAASGSTRRDARGLTVIPAFQNRNASDVVFLDERFTIAAVGDPSSPPAVGHGLRVYDTREANAAFHSSWSARVHSGGEARCLALLEDRVRVVTGGIDGTLSVVDLRMSRGSAAGGGVQARVAELPAHDDEVTCLTLESPRGRALISGCRNGDIKLWDSRTLLQLDHLPAAHVPTRHYWSGNGFGGMVGSYGVTAAVLTDRSIISCGGDGVLKVWGPGYSTSDLSIL